MYSRLPQEVECRENCATQMRASAHQLNTIKHSDQFFYEWTLGFKAGNHSMTSLFVKIISTTFAFY